MPVAYQHIVWDWNGTLLDDVTTSVNTINQLLAARALPPIDTAGYRASFGFPVRNYYLTLGFQLENENWDRLARTYHDLYLADTSPRLHPGAIPTLHFCRQAGLGLSLLSASEQSILERMVTDTAIAPWFDFIHGTDNLDGQSKLETGRRLLHRLPCPPCQILFVGDTLHDQEVAAALGCTCVLISHGHQSHERLLASGSHVLEKLEDLPVFLTAPATIAPSPNL
jgi:phosphoglycolate phosphatase